MIMAAASQFLAKTVEPFVICFSQMCRVEQMTEALCLEALELSPLIEREIEFVAVPNLEYNQLMMGMAEVSQQASKDVGDWIKTNPKAASSLLRMWMRGDGETRKS